MRRVSIKGYGTALPAESITFGDQRRFRVASSKEQLPLAVEACQKALANAKLLITDIDCIVSASAVGIQPIPCTAALIHEQIALGTHIPALDINSTCTSFITALDTISYLIEAERYQRVLIVSSEVGSQGLNPDQKESYELFGDGAAAFIIEKNQEDKGIIDAIQATWSEGAHDTEIRGGLTSLPPEYFVAEKASDYQFDMKGRRILSLSAKKIPDLMAKLLTKNQMTIADIDFAIPHQASKALPLIMKKMGLCQDQYLDIVKDYGNMVSVSVPFALAYALDNQMIHPGQTIALMGTAAGLTANILLLKV
ncbi:3-oxoacyl-ACP synthase [Streptococcus porcinus]|uniref:3-oxoacyl-ACP synthase n=1 Tax=Streptococcus porcinus TaxID=1340 RepID=A0A4V0H0L5_STRPO|nr:3-oxoacyl-[acyl-carrier-protein] synthase III C-terminal domain-containing protein [Streptococcus porcinus]VTT42122.1 3-oxoacyl-ACP synthase [Streptococcus porcinus]